MPQKKRPFHLSPPQTIAVGFAVIILLGACLLCLPIASRSGHSIGFFNALFTATSATCVTGLIVVNTLQHWTLFGHVVLLVLIQLGGLSFISILSLSMVAMRRRISLRNRAVIQASFNQDSAAGMVRLVKKVVQVTLVAEGLGALLLAISFFFSDGMPVWQALGNGVFHSISAFCNAGFDILSTESLVPWQTNLPVNLIIMALIIAGGLGFPVWGDLGDAAKKGKKRSLRTRFIHLKLHTKITLIMTAALILLGVGLFLALEWRNPETLGPLSGPHKVLAAFFQSVTLRTAGFNSISQAGLTDFSKLVSSLLMLIGGSPAGTAGGLKTVTLGVVLIAMLSALRGHGRVQALGRTLPLDLLQKALTVICTLLGVVFVATLILHFSEMNSPFPHDILDLLFEVSSAAGTVGVTTGITPHLSATGKIVIILCMYIGRLGPVTVAMALNMKRHAAGDSLRHLDERVIIG